MHLAITQTTSAWLRSSLGPLGQGSWRLTGELRVSVRRYRRAPPPQARSLILQPRFWDGLPASLLLDGGVGEQVAATVAQVEKGAADFPPVCIATTRPPAAASAPHTGSTAAWVTRARGLLAAPRCWDWRWRCADPGQAEAATSVLDQIARTSSSILDRMLTGSAQADTSSGERRLGGVGRFDYTSCSPLGYSARDGRAYHS